MKEDIGDIWTYPADEICITTNAVIMKGCEAVMGAGLARNLKKLNSIPTITSS